MKRKFSDRVGITGPGDIQLESMNRSLRNSLWNLLLNTVFTNTKHYARKVRFICRQFLREPQDIVPNNFYQARAWLREIFFTKSFEWWQVYNLIEFVADNSAHLLGISFSDKFTVEANRILEEEVSGYRFIDGTLAPITSAGEIHSIEESIDVTCAANLFGAARHLETAIELLSKRPEPDYRNSIKESISAVESLVKQITGEEAGGLGRALATLDAQVGFHGAFKSGLLSLYGYTSDEDGIRHAILEEPNVGFDEAKFMLVACSALVNFIMSKASEHGLLTGVPD